MGIVTRNFSTSLILNHLTKDIHKFQKYFFIPNSRFTFVPGKAAIDRDSNSAIPKQRIIGVIKQ
jgi:hypothetical protein